MADNNHLLDSIALTTYNGEKYLYRQMDFILNRTYKNIEVIITDDSSTDNTLEITDNFRSILYIKLFVNNSNLGVIKNFEKAISQCKGDYIALSVQDDIWLPDKIEKLLNEIDNYVLIYSDAENIDELGKKILIYCLIHSRNFGCQFNYLYIVLGIKVP